MLCKDLKDGMLISLIDEKFCAWFNDACHTGLKFTWGEDVPKRMRIGSIAVGLLSSSKIFTKKDTIIYVGKKQVMSTDGQKSRQIRLVLAGGELGFLEGYDVKYFSPVKNQNCKS